MLSARHVENEYNKMLKQHAEGAKPNAFNCYKCTACGHVTKTVDVDSGVTPFMHRCEECGEMAKSTFYSDIAPGQEPTQEWYRPTLKQVLKLRRKPAMLDHVLSGGLDVRIIVKKNDSITVYKDPNEKSEPEQLTVEQLQKRMLTRVAKVANYIHHMQLRGNKPK